MATITDPFNLGGGWPETNVGANWSEDAGEWSNSFYGGGDIGCETVASAWHRLRWVGAAITDNHRVTVECESFGDPVKPGAGARLTSGGNGYVAFIYGGFASGLSRLDSGVETVLATFDTVDVNVIANIAVEANGTTIKAYLNGVEKASVTDATHASGAPGVVQYSGDSDYGGRIYTFTAEDVGGAAGSLLLPARRIPLAILAR